MYFNGFPLVNGYNGTINSVQDALNDTHAGDTIANSFADGTNSDDSALMSIINGGWFYNQSTPLAGTINGLVPNTNYTINLIFASGGTPNSFSENLSFNGGSTAETITMSSPPMRATRRPTR